MSVGEFKEAIQEFLPVDEEYLLYVYDKFGKIMFKHEWEKLQMFKTTNSKCWKNIYSILVVLDRFSTEEQYNIISFILNESENRLRSIFNVLNS